VERRRRSKIIATLGPATDQPGVLERMIRAGVDAVRINCSHGHPQQWLARTQAIRDTAQAAGRYVAVLFDLQGPKIRLAADVRERDVAAGERVVFVGSADDRESDANVLVRGRSRSRCQMWTVGVGGRRRRPAPPGG
jgi:pyruvate kinase